MQSALIESGVVITIEAISSSSSSDVQGELWPIAVAPNDSNGSTASGATGHYRFNVPFAA